MQFFLRFCKIRHTYSVGSFCYYGNISKNEKLFIKNREKIFKYGIKYFKNEKLFAFSAKNEITDRRKTGAESAQQTEN